MALSDSLDELDQKSRNAATAPTGLENRTAELEGASSALEQRSFTPPATEAAQDIGVTPPSQLPAFDPQDTDVSLVTPDNKAIEEVQQTQEAFDPGTPKAPSLTWDQIKNDDRFKGLKDQQKLSMLNDYAAQTKSYLQSLPNVDADAAAKHVDDFVSREQNGLFPPDHSIIHNVAAFGGRLGAETTRGLFNGLSGLASTAAAHVASDDATNGYASWATPDYWMNKLGVNKAIGALAGGDPETIKKNRSDASAFLADAADYWKGKAGEVKDTVDHDKLLSESLGGKAGELAHGLGEPLLLGLPAFMATHRLQAYGEKYNDTGDHAQAARAADLATLGDTLFAGQAEGLENGLSTLLKKQGVDGIKKFAVQAAAGTAGNVSTGMILKGIDAAIGAKDGERGKAFLGALDHEDLSDAGIQAAFAVMPAYTHFVEGKARAAKIAAAHSQFLADQQKADEYAQTGLPMSSQALRESSEQEFQSKIKNLDSEVASTSAEHGLNATAEQSYGDELNQHDVFAKMIENRVSSGPKSETATDESTAAGAGGVPNAADGSAAKPVTTESGTEAPAADAEEGTTPASSPEVVNARRIADLPLADFTREVTDHPKKLTGYALEIGKQLATPEGARELSRLTDEAGARADAAKEKRDINTWTGEAFRRQFFREASEASRAAQGVEGLSVKPEDVKSAEAPATQGEQQHEQTSEARQGDNHTEASTNGEEPDAEERQVTEPESEPQHDENEFHRNAYRNMARLGSDLDAESIDSLGLKDELPEGYKREGDKYIFEEPKAEKPNESSSEAETESSATTEPSTPAKGSLEENGDRPATSTTPKASNEKRTGLVEKKKAEKAPAAIRGETQNHEQSTTEMLGDLLKASPDERAELKEKVGKRYALVQRWLSQFKLKNDETLLRVDVRAKQEAGIEDPRISPFDLLRDDLVKNFQETGDPFKTKTAKGEIKHYNVQQRMYSKLVDFAGRLENKTKTEFERGTEEGDTVSVLDDNSKHDETNDLLPSQPLRPDEAVMRDETREPVEGEAEEESQVRQSAAKHLASFAEREDLPLDAAPKATKEQIARATRIVYENILSRLTDGEKVDRAAERRSRPGPTEKLVADPEFQKAVEEHVIGGMREDLAPAMKTLREKNPRRSPIAEALFTPNELKVRREELRKTYQPEKGINNVMERIAATTKDPLQRLLAQALSKLGRNNDVSFSNVFAQKQSSAGDYHPASTNIRLSSSLSDNSFRWVAIHEKIHAVMHDKVEAFLQGDHHLLSTEDLSALRELDDLRQRALQHESVSDEVREAAGKTNYTEKLASFALALNLKKAGGEHYGLIDLHEFTTEALSNKSFQELLNNMKLSDVTGEGPAKTGSVWSRIKTLFRQVILGKSAVDENSPAAKAFDRTLDVLKSGSLEDQLARNAIKTEPDAFRLDQERQVDYLKDAAAEHGYSDLNSFALEQPELFHEATEAYRNTISDHSPEPVLMSLMPKDEEVQDETSKRAGDLYKKLDKIGGMEGKAKDIITDAMSNGASTAESFAKALTKAGMKPNVADAAGEVVQAHFKLAALDKAVEAEKTAAAQAQERDSKPAQAEPNAEPLGTSTQNAVTDQERIKHGLPPADPVARKSFGEVWDRVLNRLKAEPAYEHELVAELKNRSRAVTDEEDATLLHRQITLQNDFRKISDALNKAVDSGDIVAKGEAEARLSVKLDELHDLYEINRRVGTETGRGLNARKMMANEQYELTRMLNDKRSINGGEALSPETQAEVRKSYEKIKDLADKLLDVTNQLEDQDREARVTEKVKDIGKKVGKSTDKADLDTKRTNLLEGMKKDVEKNGLDNIDSWIRKLAKEALERGVTQPRHVVDYVHAFVSKIAPDMTRRDTMDAISGYGRWKALSKEEIDKKLRDVKGQLQQAAKLEDMLGLKESPKKTGMERRTPSDKERQLKKLVDEAKKNGGYDTSADPATRLKTALDAVKTRLKNQIKDLTERFDTGKPRPERTHLEYDDEAERMLALRDRIQQTLDEVEGERPGMTDEKRIEVAKTSLEKQIAEYDRRLKEDDFSAKDKKAPVSTPELEALRARRDALREDYKYLEAVLHPERAQEAAFRGYQTRALAKMADYRERLAAGDFAPRLKKSSLMTDPRAIKLQAELNRERQKWDLGLREDRMKRRTNPEKVMDFLAKYSRAAKLTAGTTLAKLQSAAVLRQASTNLENLTTSGLRLIPGMKTIADLAPSEGRGFHASEEYQALAKTFSQGWDDAMQTLKLGKSDLDLKFAKRLELDGGKLEFFGRLHGMLKAPVKRAAYERSLANRLEFNDRNGVDITDPGVLTRIQGEAYKDAQRSIFMQDNAMVDAYKRMLSRFQQRNKETGEVGFGHKAVETAAKVVFPIVKIPSNYVFESLVHVFGLATGPSKILSAGLRGVRSRAEGESIAAGFKEGISKLTPDEADMVMRHIKKGSLGAATMLLGFLNPSFIQAGGYYQKGEKRDGDDLAPGELRIGGVKIPSYLAHAPILEALQLGATMRRVSEQQVKGVAKGLTTGAWAALMGLTEEVPFAHEIGEVNKVMEGRVGEYFSGVAKGIAVPAGLQNIATLADQKADTHWWEMKARPVEAHSTLEKIESGIPGVRNTLPDKQQH